LMSIKTSMDQGLSISLVLFGNFIPNHVICQFV
jgi:hypothetical protein